MPSVFAEGTCPTVEGTCPSEVPITLGLSARWGLDPPTILEPVEDRPAKGGPGCSDAPAGEHIGGIVNSEVDTTNADSDGEQDRQAEEINLEP